LTKPLSHLNHLIKESYTCSMNDSLKVWLGVPYSLPDNYTFWN